MHHFGLMLFFAALSLSFAVQAEETASPGAQPVMTGNLEAAQARIGELERQLESSLDERENAQMARLRQENQKLKLQLRAALAKQSDSLLSEEQTWYLTGGVLALVGVVVGALLRGNRRRRQWIN